MSVSLLFSVSVDCFGYHRAAFSDEVKANLYKPQAELMLILFLTGICSLHTTGIGRKTIVPSMIIFTTTKKISPPVVLPY